VTSGEKVLAQFLGDDAFPVTWESEGEKGLFWVYDDLHCPHPLSPMFFDIGGWWLTCDHMFRRFGTPFAVDWLAKNVNGYLYTAAVPPDPSLRVDSSEYGARYGARVPLDPRYSDRTGAYLDAVLPVYGEHFADWWRDRLRPEMERNFAYVDGMIDDANDLSLMELACLLEDTIDIHDRHWKIHWMLNFAQLSSTLNLRKAMEKWRGGIDEALLGRLQSSAADRNWDSIEALWQMKQEVAADAELSAAFRQDGAAAILEALNGSERGRRFLADRVGSYQREFGWHAVWSHELIFPTLRENPEPVIDLVRNYFETDYDYPAALAAVKADLEEASRQLVQGLEGEARDELEATNAVNLRLAPLTPDHHFYIDQGANARLRLVLMTIGTRLVANGVLENHDDIVFLRYNEMRALLGDVAALDARDIVHQRRQERAAAYELHPPDWIGTATPSQLAFPYLVNWGYPERFYRTRPASTEELTGIAVSAGVVEGTARVVRAVEEFDEVAEGEILVCQMTNPAWVVLFTRIAGLVTDTGGTTSHPAVLAREFAIPAVVGTSVATRRIETGDRVRVNGSTGVVEILARQLGGRRAGQAETMRS
jgi:phosphohistidine swiveling domain-containing protein